MKHDPNIGIPKEVITYAAGVCEGKIAEIARNSNQPEQELREWVAVFFLSEGQRFSNNLPTLRGKATRTYKTSRKMAMANNTHSPSSQKHFSNNPNKVDSIGRRIGKRTSRIKGFKYNGTHWTQQPKNRKRVQELARLRAKAIAAKKAAT